MSLPLLQIAAPLKLGFKRLFALSRCGFITRGVDPNVVAGPGLDSIQLRQHAKVGAMRAEENIAWQLLEGCECAPVVTIK
ncbi:MAG: hypothetical protein ABI356_07715 [Steroidobacteraceae bacterium]